MDTLGSPTPTSDKRPNKKGKGQERPVTPPKREIDPALSHLQPGQTINCHVAFGRRDNIVAEIHVTTGECQPMT